MSVMQKKGASAVTTPGQLRTTPQRPLDSPRRGRYGLPASCCLGCRERNHRGRLLQRLSMGRSGATISTFRPSPRPYVRALAPSSCIPALVAAGGPLRARRRCSDSRSMPPGLLHLFLYLPAAPAGGNRRGRALRRPSTIRGPTAHSPARPRTPMAPNADQMLGEMSAQRLVIFSDSVRTHCHAVLLNFVIT